MLISPVISGTFDILVDSGLSDCFVDSAFVSKYCLPFLEINSLSLILIDGTINHIMNYIV